MNALDRPDQGRGLLALVVSALSALSAEGRYGQRPAQHRTLGFTRSKTLSPLNPRGLAWKRQVAPSLTLRNAVRFYRNSFNASKPSNVLLQFLAISVVN